MRTMDADSIDSIVSDPPYGLSFMGKGWDHGVPSVEFWVEALRVAKPGAHLLAFGGTRTQHRLTCAIEDAGWEVRDCIMWVYGSGFPKSLNVGKAIDKMAGAERVNRLDPRWAARYPNGPGGNNNPTSIGSHGRGSSTLKRNEILTSDPATDAAKQWDGWGTALKPAYEPIIVARKSCIGTIAENVLTHGTGAINVDGCRVEAEKATGWSGDGSKLYEGGLSRDGGEARLTTSGRFPANFIHDGSDEVMAEFPNVKGGTWCRTDGARHFNNDGKITNHTMSGVDSTIGSAARFFYCAKASKQDRDDGNTHPTVKPTALMRYLCKLVTQPNGIILDPFMGSGSTGKAAMLEGFRFVGIDITPEYIDIARARIEHASKQNDGELFSGCT